MELRHLQNGIRLIITDKGDIFAGNLAIDLSAECTRLLLMIIENGRHTSSFDELAAALHSGDNYDPQRIYVLIHKIRARCRTRGITDLVENKTGSGYRLGVNWQRIQAPEAA